MIGRTKVGRRRRLEEKMVAPALPVNPRVTGRGLKPDARHGSLLVSKFVNSMMWEGKKTVSAGILQEALTLIGQKSGQDPLEVLTRAVENVKPFVEVRSQRVGGATYQVPVNVPEKRRLSLAIRWLLEAARAKKGRPMSQRLASELLDAYRKEGAAITKRENTHKMAEANKAFAHFAW